MVENAQPAGLSGHQEGRQGKGHLGIRVKAALFAWMHGESGGHMIYPDLLDFVSQEVEEDDNSEKQTREVGEEQFLARRSKKEDT